MNGLLIVIITGISGSGKSTAMAAFEDTGFYCVDNMPVALLPKFLELPAEYASEITGLAFAMDLREKSFLFSYEAVFDWLRKRHYNYRVLFLDADEEVLVKRYSETRRHHPLSLNGTLIEGIRKEKEQLEKLRHICDQVIDTSDFTVHQLKSYIFDYVSHYRPAPEMRITVMSFGFKFGVPREGDLIMDVRFLPNPYFVARLKEMTGREKEVSNFVLNSRETGEFLEKYLDLLEMLIPLYKKEGKAYLTIAFGCTGGKHRSVAIAEYVRKRFQEKKMSANIFHRDVEK